MPLNGGSPRAGSPLPSAIFGYAIAGGENPGLNLLGSSKLPLDTLTGEGALL